MVTKPEDPSIKRRGKRLAGRSKKAATSAAEPEVLPPEPSPAEEQGDVEVEILPPDVIDQHETLPVEVDSHEAEEEKRTGVVPYDPLEAYLREISRYSTLSPAEEKELALDYYHNKDLEAAYRLISSNLWLAVKIARDYEKAARNLLDLIQEGNMGLMEAVKNFDPYRGVRFPSYAVWWIKAYIIRYIIANWRLVKLGTTQAQRKLFFNLRKERDKLEREGFYPGPKLLAEKLNVRESDVVEMEQRLSGSDVSFDAPLTSDSDSSLLTVLDSGQMTAEDHLARKEAQLLVKQSLEDFAATLNEKELMIFRQRMLSEEKVTLQELADSLSLSKERIRQIENRLRDKLKAFMIERIGSKPEGFDLEF